jgi:hypothetical protein
MKKLIVYHGDSPVSVEGFAGACTRSCKGAIHILPGKPKTITSDEFEHLKAKYGWMMPKVKIISEMKGQAQQVLPQETPAPAADVAEVGESPKKAFKKRQLQ